MRVSSVIRAIDRRVPPLDYNAGQKRNLRKLEELLTASPGRKRLLVVGAGSAGAPIVNPEVECVLTDVVDDGTIDVVCDAHNLPFEDDEFDAVVVIAVLEHVLDPVRVVAEIHRVLREDGLVYSEIPFLQRVHAGAWDFTRFTMLGHRRLFRMFDPILAEPIAGPASSLAWALNGFLLALVGRNWVLWHLTDRATKLLLCWLPQLDRLLLRAPAAEDAACGTAFLGRKRASPVPDEEIMRQYRGAVPTPVSALRAEAVPVAGHDSGHEGMGPEEAGNTPR